MALLRVTALTGLIIALYNMLVNFVFLPEVLWWNGVLHLPLLFISLYALILAYRKGGGETAVFKGQETYR